MIKHFLVYFSKTKGRIFVLFMAQMTTAVLAFEKFLFSYFKTQLMPQFMSRCHIKYGSTNPHQNVHVCQRVRLSWELRLHPYTDSSSVSSCFNTAGIYIHIKRTPQGTLLFQSVAGMSTFVFIFEGKWGGINGCTVINVSKCSVFHMYRNHFRDNFTKHVITLCAVQTRNYSILILIECIF